MACCPRCSSNMEEVELAGLTLDVCSYCRGAWFDAHELMRAVEMDAMTLSALPFYGDLEARDDSWEQSPAFCPRCSSALEPQRFDRDLGVIIDVCPNEHGFWLDGGELHRIKEFCAAVSEPEEEVEDTDPERVEKMMEKHRKSLKGFRITYGVPEPPVYTGPLPFIFP